MSFDTKKAREVALENIVRAAKTSALYGYDVRDYKILESTIDRLSLLESERDRLKVENGNLVNENGAQHLEITILTGKCDRLRKGLEEIFKYPRTNPGLAAIENIHSIAFSALESSEPKGREVTVGELGQAIICAEGDIERVAARLLEVFDIRRREGR